MTRPPTPFSSRRSSRISASNSSSILVQYSSSTDSLTSVLADMTAVSKLKKAEKLAEKMPMNPPSYSPHPPILRNNRYKSRKRSERRAVTMFLTKLEKCYLMLFTTFALISLLCTFLAIFVDKNAIYGTDDNKSICMLSDTHDCRTEFPSILPKYIVAVGVRVDLMLSCILFVSGVMLTSFRVFNSRILVGFMLVGVFKFAFIACSVLIILTSNEFYFDTINVAFEGMCGEHFCVDDERLNIVVAFFLLLGSGLASAFMLFTVFTIGSKLLSKLEDQHYEATWAKWDAMTADLVAH